MMTWTDDPVRDAERYEYEQDEMERKSCSYCLLNDDSEICKDCIELGIEYDGCDY